MVVERAKPALGVSSAFDAGSPIWQLYCGGALGDESEWLRMDATDGVWGGLVRWVRCVLAQREEVWRLQERQYAGQWLSSHRTDGAQGAPVPFA
jgi:hypothetical protein